jgi:hypothetical protein
MDKNGTSPELYQDVEIQKRVAEVWEIVFSASNKVINQANVFGFNGMHIPNPDIHMMMTILRMYEEILQVIIDGACVLGIDYDGTRLALNAKEQINRMERVVSALNAERLDDFNAAIDDLKRQAAF